MPQLLVEIFCEEIPARMQAQAARDLERMLGEKLAAAGLEPESLATLAGPRRLTAVAEGLAAKSPDVSEERKGPRVGAPDKAVEGFLRGAGVATLEACEQREDAKGAFWVARIERPGRKTPDAVAEIVPAIIRGFAWPKSMRWGEGTLRWVRPIQRVLCVFDGKAVPFEIEGIKASNVTEGHRLMGRGPFKVTGFDDYKAQLEGEGHVILDAAERRTLILEGARKLCADAKLELVEDEGLLNEVAGLVEWPVPLLGDMDPSFLDLPPEVIRLSMRTHQKYFAVRDPKTDGLAAKFVAVANQVAPDGGKAIAAGNARVLSARLNDARYFWDLDQRTSLEVHARRLDQIVFHKSLGSMQQKAKRVAALAKELAPKVGADVDLAERAALLMKADLVTEMVGEFPELQGVMGRYYALREAGIDPISLTADKRRSRKQDELSVADAIRDHYRPQGPSDEIPNAPVSITVALADKLDTLTGFWALGEKPTGSRDPYALRRAALGVIRICLGHEIHLTLGKDLISQIERLLDLFYFRGKAEAIKAIQDTTSKGVHDNIVREAATKFAGSVRTSGAAADPLAADMISRDLLAFFADRLKVHLRDEGHRHDLVDAVFALGEDDLVLIVKRVEALGRFLDTDDGANLLAAYKRAMNIVRAEEKKGFDLAQARQTVAGKGAGFAAVMAALSPLLQAREEVALHKALNAAASAAYDAVQQEAFEKAMKALAPLRPAVDAFFDRVTVNVDDEKLRRARLLLLAQFHEALARVADFSRIEG